MFGDGPLANEVARRVRAVGAAIDRADVDGPAHPWSCALVSLEGLVEPQSNVAIEVFGVVDRLVASRSRWGGGMPTVVVVAPGGGGPARAGARLAETLALFLGGPKEANLVVMEAPAASGPDAIAEASDEAIALLSGKEPKPVARLW